MNYRLASFRLQEMKLNLLCIATLLCGIGTIDTWSQEKGQKEPYKHKAGVIGLVFEAAFEDPEVTAKLDNARKTRLAAAFTSTLGTEMFTKANWKQGGWDWVQFSKPAGELADKLAKEIEPKYIRDPRGVIDYAIISDRNPFISSAITSPYFLKPFENTLGKKLHVIVVDRHVLYIFPASGSALSKFSKAIRGVYKSTPTPVSLEIIEVDKTGYRVIGEIEQPIKTKFDFNK